MEKNTLIDEFMKLDFQQKKEKLLAIISSGETKDDESTVDLIWFINSLPDWSNESLVDIYKSMIASANEFEWNENIIVSLDRWINQMKKYEMDLDQEIDREEAEEILKHIS
jgi:hypothetical protein